MLAIVGSAKEIFPIAMPQIVIDLIDKMTTTTLGTTLEEGRTSVMTENIVTDVKTETILI